MKKKIPKKIPKKSSKKTSTKKSSKRIAGKSTKRISKVSKSSRKSIRKNPKGYSKQGDFYACDFCQRLDFKPEDIKHGFNCPEWKPDPNKFSQHGHPDPINWRDHMEGPEYDGVRVPKRNPFY